MFFTKNDFTLCRICAPSKSDTTMSTFQTISILFEYHFMYERKPIRKIIDARIFSINKDICSGFALIKNEGTSRINNRSVIINNGIVTTCFFQSKTNMQSFTLPR